MIRTKSEWLVKFRPKTTASNRPISQHTLLCFPHAGGSASVFSEWESFLPSSIDLWAVQYPGRGLRFRQPAYTVSKQLIDQLLADETTFFLQRPLVLFGHSMGALLAFELARALRRRGFPQPLHLFVSGHHAPHLPGLRYDQPVAGMDDAEFSGFLQSMAGTPPAVLANAELMELMLPMLRADFGLCDDYHYQQQRPLTMPLTAFGGRNDDSVDAADLLAWQQHSTGSFASHFFEGGHFFVDEFRPKIIRHIVSSLHAAPV